MTPAEVRLALFEAMAVVLVVTGLCLLVGMQVWDVYGTGIAGHDLEDLGAGIAIGLILAGLATGGIALLIRLVRPYLVK